MDSKKIKTILDLVKVVVTALAAFFGSMSAQSCCNVHFTSPLNVDSTKVVNTYVGDTCHVIWNDLK